MAASQAEDPEMAKEATKVLKKMGFPCQEVAATPTASLTRVQMCLTRRMAVFDTLISEATDMVAATKKKNKPFETYEKSLIYTLQSQPFGTLLYFSSPADPYMWTLSRNK